VSFVIRLLGLNVAYLCTKFEPYSFSHFRDMVGALQNLNGSRDLTTLLSGMICHPWASTCNYQPTYRIWTLYLHPLRRYERRYKISKCGGLGSS